MNILGFTGTQNGMTAEQKESVSRLIKQLIPRDAIDGDCIGADTDFHNIFKEVMGFYPQLYPANTTMKRAFNTSAHIHEPKEPLTRNRDIVNDSEFMIATPSGMEVVRSGTWMTVRYTKKLKKTLYIVWGNGKIQRYMEFNGKYEPEWFNL